MDTLGAERLAPGVLRVQRHFGLAIRHGLVRLGDCLSALPDLIDAPAGHPGGWLSLDTEIRGALAGRGLSAAIEARAKYLEHRERDYARALEWVDRLPMGSERERRRRRLEGKLRGRIINPLS